MATERNGVQQIKCAFLVKKNGHMSLIWWVNVCVCVCACACLNVGNHLLV